jgi:hypothetical protein
MRQKPIRMLGLLLLAATASAQSDRGTITGTVSDQAQAVIPNAKILATNTETQAQFETATTGTGNYTLPQLPAGEYDLNVSAAGFSTFIQKGLTIQVAQIARIDVTLKVGAASESVSVTADAPLLKTENAEQSTDITIARFEELPLVSASGLGGAAALINPWAFTTIMPGASIASSGGSNINLRVNGLPNNTFTTRIDGQDATFTQQESFSAGSQPSVEALEEVALQTSNFSAEYGQVGGGLYNFTSKSGTNKLHGSGFEYFRDEFLNAGQPFTNGGNGQLIRPQARSHDYGFTLGGPLVIPHFYNGRNKTFFFVSLEQNYAKTVTTNAQTLPTDAYRTGDFSAALTGKKLGTDVMGNSILENEIYDPASATSTGYRTPFPNNIIPMSRLDPVALKIEALMPQPSNTALVNNWEQSYTSPVRSTVQTSKVDENISTNQKLSFYMSWRLNNSPWNNADGLPIPLTGSRYGRLTTPTLRLTYNFTIRPTMLLNVGIGMVRGKQQDAAELGVLQYNALTQLGLYAGATTNYTGVVSPGFPRITGLLGSDQGGMSLSMGPANANEYYGEKPTAVSSFTWIHENHTVKIGAEWRKDAHSDNNVRGSQGIFNFTNTETALPTNQTTSGGTAGFPYASFLLGLADSASVNAPQDPQERQIGYGLYLQDNWKITRKVTLDYGLRWDYQTALSELWNRQDNFSPTTPNENAGGLLGGFAYQGYGPGRCQCSAFSKSYPYAVQPRLGIAYQIDPKTVLRAGWGISYAANTQYGYITNQAYLGVGINQLSWVSPSYGIPAVTFAQGLPYQQSQLYQVTLDPGARPYPGQLATVPYWEDPQGGRPGRVNQWNVSLQREVGRNFVVEAAYVGNRGVWLPAASLNNLNAITPAMALADGINITNSTQLSLLTQPLNSAAVIAAGYKPPYAGYPANASLGQSLRPFPQFTTIPALWSPLGNDWYDSLQAKATKRLSHGLDFTGAFTWQKELQLGADGGAINDFQSRSLNKSISPYSVPLELVISFTYHTPVWGVNRLARNVTSGWALGGILRYQSGLPILIPAASSNSLSNGIFQTTYANRVPGVQLFLVKNLNCKCFDPNTTLVLNPAAWSQPAPGTFGNSSLYYNDYRNFRQPAESLSLGRFFTIREGMQLELRAMFFNPFNHVFLNAPASTNALATTTTNSSGQLTGGFGWVNTGSVALQPRNGMLLARFSF